MGYLGSEMGNAQKPAAWHILPEHKDGRADTAGSAAASGAASGMIMAGVPAMTLHRLSTGSDALLCMIDHATP